MEPGGKHRTTAMSGNRARPRQRAVGGPTQMAAGSIPMLAGPGCRKSHSVGPPITTADGRGCTVSAGSGCPAMNGRRPGSRGERARITSAGRRCRPKRASIVAAASGTGRIIITTSDPTNTPSCRQMNSLRSASDASWFQPSAMSRSCLRRRMSPTSPTRIRRS